VRAVEHAQVRSAPSPAGVPCSSHTAQTYWNLLEKVPPRELKLTKMDDEIYEHTMREFPEMAEPPHDKVTKLDEDWLKSPEGKERWHKFISSCVCFFRMFFAVGLTGTDVGTRAR
jgi:hypothetical protein